jgi:hypothetical protein
MTRRPLRRLPSRLSAAPRGPGRPRRRLLDLEPEALVTRRRPGRSVVVGQVPARDGGRS